VLPEIKKLASLQAEQLEIVTINVDRNKADWLRNYQANSLTWSSLHDDKGRNSEVNTKYHVFATPTYYLFNKHGKLLNKWTGYDSELIPAILMLLSNSEE